MDKALRSKPQREPVRVRVQVSPGTLRLIQKVTRGSPGWAGLFAMRQQIPLLQHAARSPLEVEVAARGTGSRHFFLFKGLQALFPLGP